jgi:tetratricopeptide (TPR) repeat protein
MTRRRNSTALKGCIWVLVAVAMACSSPGVAPRAPTLPKSLAAPRPIGLLRGRGHWHRLVATRDRRAQESYDQGLAMLAEYSWVDAARSFHEALLWDSKLAAAWVGLAHAERALGDTDAARRSLEHAHRAADDRGVEARDRQWVDLARIQQRAIDAPSLELAAGTTKYQRAIETYLRSFPRDADGFVLRGDAEGGAAAQGQTGTESSLKWYKAALKLAPDHLAALHHLAHSLENLGRWSEALEPALRFATLAPRAPHAQHLVGHLLARLGRWQEAIERFELADRLHRERFLREALAPQTDWDFGHNLNLLAAAYWHLGRTAQAEFLWHEAFALDERGPRAGALCLPWIELNLLEGRDDLALEGASACSKRDSRVARVIGYSVEGEVKADRGELAGARACLGKAEAELEKEWTRSSPLPARGVAISTAARTVQALKGKLALQQGNGVGGVRRLELLANRLASLPTFDGWASAVLRLRELESYARRHHRPDLAVNLSLLISEDTPE